MASGSFRPRPARGPTRGDRAGRARRRITPLGSGLFRRLRGSHSGGVPWPCGPEPPTGTASRPGPGRAVSVYLGGVYFQTSGVQRFLGGLMDEVAQGRSTLLLLPPFLEPNRVWSALRDLLPEREF